MNRTQTKRITLAVAISGTAVVVFSIFGLWDVVLRQWYLAKLRCDDPEEIERAVETMVELGFVGTAISASLPEANGGFSVRQLVTINEVLERSLRDDVPTLAGALTNRSPTVCRRAAELLGFFEEDCEAGVPALIRALSDEARDVRIEAALALWQIRKSFAESIGPAVTVLIDMLQDLDAERRHQAAYLLSRVPGAARRAIPALVNVLDDDNLATCQRAAMTLGLVGDEARVAVPALLRLLESDHTDGALRLEVARALTQLGAEAAVPALVSVSRRDYRDVILNLGKSAVPSLIRALGQGDLPARRSAALQLGWLGRVARPAVEALTVALDDPDAEVRFEAAQTLRVVDVPR